jgi:hypothetical protein
VSDSAPSSIEPASANAPLVASDAPTLADRIANVAWGTVGALPLLTAALLLTPSPKGMGTHQQLGLPPCTFLYLTGFPCPFCGMTTSWTHAAHGQVFESIRAQPMGFAFFAVDFFLVAWILGLALLGRAQFRPERFLTSIPRPVWWSGLSLTAVAWMYKIAIVRGWL